MPYPTTPVDGDKVGANLVPRPSFPTTDKGAWSVGTVDVRDVGGGQMVNRLAGFTDTKIELPGIPVAAATFRITALIITTNSQCYMGVRPIGSAELVGNVTTGSIWQWVTITDSIGAGESGSGLELYLRTPTSGSMGLAFVRVDYSDSPVAGAGAAYYFDGNTPDTAERNYVWDGTAFASPSSVLAIVAADEPPSIPTGLTVTDETDTTISLSWAASTDDVGVAGYNVYEGATKLNGSLVAGTTYTATSLVPGTEHTYTVRAVDTAAQESGASAPATGTTTDTGEPPPPEPPPELPPPPVWVSESAQRVAAFLGVPTDASVLTLAATVTPVVYMMAKAYTRDQGFARRHGVAAQPNQEIAAVITSASARMVANPEQIPTDVGATAVRGAFTGWTLPELAVLNRYRKRAA